MQGFIRSDDDRKEDEIILSDYLRLLFRNTHWIVISVILSILLAYLNLRYQDHVFQSSGSIKIESENNNLLSEISIFKDLNPKDKVLTEAHILKSKRLILKACETLPIQTSYFSKGRVVNKELYTSSPFLIKLVKTDSINYDKMYELTLLSPKQFKITYLNDAGELINLKGNFGDTIYFDRNKIQVTYQYPDYNLSLAPTNTFNFIFNSESSLYFRIMSGLDVSQADKGVALLNVNYSDHVPEFAADFINALLRVYTEFDIEIKSQTATQTIAFMESLQNDMDRTVRGSEQKVEDFKKKNNVFNLDVKGESSFKNLSELETQNRLLQLQILSIENLEKQISENKTNSYLPLSIDGLADPVLADLLSNLNKLTIERISRSEKVTPRHASVIELEKQIDELRKSIRMNVASAKKKINSQLAYLKREIELIQSDMRSLPTEEQQLINLKRDMEVNQRVYGFLLQTKLEAAISRASIVSSARIIDMAEPSYFPIYPNTKMTYLLFVLGGVVLCVVIILIFRFFNNKVYSLDEIEAASSIPVIGSVMAFPQKLLNTDSRMLAIREHKSVFGESIRSVRTNLQFLLPDKEKKVITITSTVSGEGKTFTSINLAGSLTMLGKKVVLIGCDMRKPQLETTFENPNKLGLSSYLAGACGLDDIVQATNYENLSLIFSGPVPPNPAELLHSERMITLIEVLKERFDYVLLDTSPIGLVADAVVLIKMSDVVIYVVKAGYSQRGYLELPSKLRKEHSLSNIYLLLNSYKVDKLSHRGGYYGYGSGNYGYYVNSGTQSKFDWRKFFRFRS